MPEVIFNGPEGRLEGRYQHNRDPNAPIALMLHPHPQHGGTMNNKVVYTLYQAFARRGFSVLRFNFRGVGRIGSRQPSAGSPIPQVAEGTLLTDESSPPTEQNIAPSTGAIFVGRGGLGS